MVLYSHHNADLIARPRIPSKGTTSKLLSEEVERSDGGAIDGRRANESVVIVDVYICEFSVYRISLPPLTSCSFNSLPIEYHVLPLSIDIPPCSLFSLFYPSNNKLPIRVEQSARRRSFTSIPAHCVSLLASLNLCSPIPEFMLCYHFSSRCLRLATVSLPLLARVPSSTNDTSKEILLPLVGPCITIVHCIA